MKHVTKTTTIRNSRLGLTVILDNDPRDEGAMAIVIKGKGTCLSASWDCALETGELGCGEYTLTKEETMWLLSIDEEVCELLDGMDS